MVPRKSKVSKLELPASGTEQPEGNLPVDQSLDTPAGERDQHPVWHGAASKFLTRIRIANSALDIRTQVPVTVIVPVWLRSETDIDWLLEAVESVFDQTVLCNTIIVENGSSLLPDMDGRVTIIHSEKGLSIARNAGVRASSTEFFFPLDANDWLPQNAIETALKKMPPTGFLYGSTMLFSQARGMGDQHLYDAKPYDFREIMKMVYFPNGALQRRADWEATGGYREDLPFLEDWDYWMTAGEKGICGTAIPDVLYWYRQHSGMVSTHKHTPEWENIKALIQSYHKDIYKGDFPPMCCGHKNKPASPYVPPSAQSLVTPGSDGMLLIEYIGGNAGKMPWYGPVTGARYTAGGSQKRLYVDIRDALTGSKQSPGLLEVVDHGNPLFQKVD